MNPRHTPLPVTTSVTGPQWGFSLLLGLVLALAVWKTLVQGGGLVGGDTYPYFFPQKQLMAETLRHGTLPLWHDRTGLGYPLHAESQAGVFYPSNQVLYRLTDDINTAYSASLILHYWMAFVLAWRFIRTQHVSHASSLLGALIFVYGWFPARVSLEWSIIGGVWLPAALWMTDRLLESPTRPRFAALSACLAVHLLAGHFTLAFISQLCCCGYAAIRLTQQYRTQSLTCRGAVFRLGTIGGAIVVSLLLASVQLIPTLELKTLSQREGTNAAFDPGYGHLPPLYLTQLVASWWYWHTPEVVAARELTRFPYFSSRSATNQVEAHLYFGMIPLVLLLCALNPRVRHRLRVTTWTTWTLLSAAAVIYATGWLIPVTRHLPGFGFFMGPGRYTIITTLGAAILSGLSLDSLLARRRPLLKIGLTLLAGGLTMPDLLLSSRYPVRDAVDVPQPPLHGLTSSWIASYVREAGPGNLRLLAPGPNVANLYGVSCVPQYLGLGPADYYVDEKTYRTQPESGNQQTFPADDELPRLAERGVTHILCTEPLTHPSAELELVAAQPDSFLNAVWGRGSQPCFLYRFRRPPQRVFAIDSVKSIDWSWQHRTPDDLSFRIDLPQASVIGLRELMLPGWQVEVDGQPAAPVTESGFTRQVKVAAGTHTIRWIYRPASFRWGCLVSLGSLAAMGLWLFRGRRRPASSITNAPQVL